MSHERVPEVEMLQKMLDAQSAAIYTFDKNRTIIYSNKAAKNAMHVGVAGKGVGAAEVDHFENNSYYDEGGNQLLYPKGSAIELALKGTATHDLVLEHRNYQTHTHRWLSVSCEPVLDEGGQFLYGIMSHRDVSLRKSREHKLQFLVESAKTLSITMDFKKRLEEKAKLTVPTLADWCAIDILESDGSLTRMALVHRDPKKLEFLKEYEHKYPTPKDMQQPVRVVQSGVTEFIPFVSDEMIEATPDLLPEQIAAIKELKLTSIVCIPIRSKNRVYGALTLAFAESGRLYTQDDVTFFEEFSYHLSVVLENAQLYQEISERDLSKDAFLAQLSHELRNPLAPIKSALELLRLKEPSSDILEEVDMIEHQFDHMTRLLTDLLDANRFMHGKIELEMQNLHIEQMVRRLVLAIEPLAQKSQIHIDASIEQGLGLLYGDSTRLEQAFSNLLHNAVKFTPKGGTLGVQVHKTEEHFCFTVADSGIGITEEEMPHIFEPYYQSDRVKHGNHGLGIGLRLVQEIVRLHGGTITAKSDGLGMGSEFTMCLPLAVTNIKKLQTSTAPLVAAINAPRRILIVDDNSAATDSMVKLLSLLGWDAKGLYSAQSAITYLESEQADIILLDIGMPEMDGYQLARHLRQERALTVPIIAISGYGMEEDKQKAYESGFTMHLTKPVGKQELTAALQEILV